MDEDSIQHVVESVVRQMKSKRSFEDVTLHMAKQLIDAVEKEASRLGIQVVIAVANKGANPVAIHCMDDAYIASYDIAFHKAYTCAALKMATSTLKPMCEPGKELYGIQYTNQGKIVIFGGGIPILHKGKCIGGLGVSGGSEDQDTALAKYGEKLIKEGALWQ